MLLGEVLIRLFGLRQDDINRSLDVQKEIGGYIGQILINSGLINEYQLISALSEQLNIPLFDNETFKGLDSDLINDLSERLNIDYLLKHSFLPISRQNSHATFLTNDPLNGYIIDYITMSLGSRVRLALATEQTIAELSRPLKSDDRDVVSLLVGDSPEALKEMASEAPVIKFLNNLLSTAVDLRASDIHLEPSEGVNRIKMRIDGVLHENESINEKLYLAVVSRIKLLAGLDIAEKRLPQDGKFSTKIASTLIDLRVSTIPFAVGEGVVMRLLYRARLTFDITRLGIERDVVPLITELINMPYGILLVTGPTGSGKTTTLYSMLSSIDRKEKKIITVEDPVEYKLEGVNQIQVKGEIGLSFAASLRSILRHDPDVIMVGEIRDPETAEVAVQSALTGHLVLSTLHTNDAPSCLFRLVEMGLEDYLLNASIIGVIAQRIVRKNCDNCSSVVDLSPTLLNKYAITETYEMYKDVLGLTIGFRRGAGCRKCAGTGYRGMIAIYEVFKYTDDLKETFLNDHSLEVFKRQLINRHTFRTLRQDGIIKVISGITTIEEVLRVS
ncbi:MAG: Flp pilus assembly complex ATPase component TadA [Nitrospirae bacterium]|nr:Flp pilus assembly complex ATPase component TadA [Nitrospirota bacterium]